MDYWQILLICCSGRLHILLKQSRAIPVFEYSNSMFVPAECRPDGWLVYAFSFHINAWFSLQRDKTLKWHGGKQNGTEWLLPMDGNLASTSHAITVDHWFNMYLKQMHAFLHLALSMILWVDNKNLVVYRSRCRCRCVVVPFVVFISNASNAPPSPPQNDAINVNHTYFFIALK